MQKIASHQLRARVDSLLQGIAAATAGPGVSVVSSSAPGPEVVRHVVAFSGGVDSSLAAALVHQVWGPTATAACLGVSSALSAHQHQQARDVARAIGITLWEIPTAEAEVEGYVTNTGQSCYHCKTTLYSTLEQVMNHAIKTLRHGTDNLGALGGVIYNGTNRDDLKDPTRLGLVAAEEFDVVSPLKGLTKAEVRETAKYLGLPNWNAAASPCLRSRLAFGVEATERHLKRIEAAETFVRRTLSLSSESNMRVRLLTGNRAAIELDSRDLASSSEYADGIMAELQRLGFAEVEFRPFRSGSLSGYGLVAVEHTAPDRVL